HFLVHHPSPMSISNGSDRVNFQGLIFQLANFLHFCAVNLSVNFIHPLKRFGLITISVISPL
ncbi:MAG: hypothetical protein Q8762_01885, partial [Pigeon pea little leaf phytoplasma]